jgi:hypothetical protein
MDTIGSLITIALVLAAIFVPQALVIFLSERREVPDEEYVPDGR